MSGEAVERGDGWKMTSEPFTPLHIGPSEVIVDGTPYVPAAALAAAEERAEQAEERLAQARKALDRVIEASLERWHTVVNDEPHVASWLGLTDAEYEAWVERGADGLLAALGEPK